MMWDHLLYPTKRIHKFCLLALKLLASNPSYKQYGATEVTSLLLSEHPTVPLGAGVAEFGLVALFDLATRDPRAVTGAAIMLGRVAIDVVSAREKIKTTHYRGPFRRVWGGDHFIASPHSSSWSFA